MHRSVIILPSLSATTKRINISCKQLKLHCPIECSTAYLVSDTSQSQQKAEIKFVAPMAMVPNQESPPSDGFLASPSSSSAAAVISSSASLSPSLSRYESQKRRDWNTFGQYLRNHRPPLSLSRCSGAHVLEFLRYLDQFGKTKVHTPMCPFFGHPNPPSPCPCPLRQAWGSLDALIGRLRAAFEENGGKPEANPFGARAVRLYLREIREMQAKARGVSYEKKKRKKPPQPPQPQPRPSQPHSPSPGTGAAA